MLSGIIQYSSFCDWLILLGIIQGSPTLYPVSMFPLVGEASGNQLQYSCLGKPRAEETGGVHGVAEESGGTWPLNNTRYTIHS